MKLESKFKDFTCKNCCKETWYQLLPSPSSAAPRRKKCPEAQRAGGAGRSALTLVGCETWGLSEVGVPLLCLLLLRPLRPALAVGGLAVVALRLLGLEVALGLAVHLVDDGLPVGLEVAPGLDLAPALGLRQLVDLAMVAGRHGLGASSQR